MRPFFRRRPAPDQPRGDTAAHSGPAAEAFARNFLRNRGLAIIASNYRTRFGEIDIIARDCDALAFVEVRLRSSSAFGGARESIDQRKQRRIISAARQYLQDRGLVDTAPCRFDALCLSPLPGTNDWRVDWIRDAFRPEC